ncbi:MAG: nucleotidyltransferase [Bacillota bacterium]
MKVAGIIVEYNPFHNGHLYHLQQSSQLSQADAVIAVMSGNFVQRGKPAIIDKWSRTKMALKAGVDLILELPLVYALRSAEHFAYGAIELLNKTEVVDNLIFGSEIGKIAPLREIGEVLATEPPQLSQLIQAQLDDGSSFPQARAQALQKYFLETETTFDHSQLAEIISNPNNILGIEYIKALVRTKSKIKPLTIKRCGADYHQTTIKGQIASATAIRNSLLSNRSLSSVKNSIPDYTYNLLLQAQKEGRTPIALQDFTLPLLTLLRRTTSSQLTAIEDVTGGLENRIKEAANNTACLTELINKIKTKRFTQTRIQRILLQFLLDLNQKLLHKFDQSGGPQYLRVLGFNQQGQQLLSLINKQSITPVISKVSNHYRSNYPPTTLSEEMLAMEVRATNLYSLAYNNPQLQISGQDYRPPVILKK